MGSEQRHTPGPWRVAEGKHGWRFPDVLAFDQPSGRGTYTVVASSVAPENAHLIASAPDLYAALDSLLAAYSQERIGADGEPEPCVVKALAALAKARGEDPR